jgi:hypothetical protein
MFAAMIVGFPFGFAFGNRSRHDSKPTLSYVLALSEYETLAGLQYKEADVPHGKDALLNLLRFMDHVEADSNPAIRSQIDLDRGIAYMRLALLAEKRGDAAEYKDYVVKAQENLKKGDGHDFPEDHLHEQVVKFDSTPTYKLPGIFLLSRRAAAQ